MLWVRSWRSSNSIAAKGNLFRPPFSFWYHRYVRTKCNHLFSMFSWLQGNQKSVQRPGEIGPGESVDIIDLKA